MVCSQKMKVMTSRDRDWIDDLLDDEPINVWQIGMIEQLLITSSASCLYDNIKIEELTNEEASEIIFKLKENDNPRDPKDQFYKIFGKGW
jgi:hypothetical protein